MRSLLEPNATQPDATMRSGHGMVLLALAAFLALPVAAQEPLMTGGAPHAPVDLLEAAEAPAVPDGLPEASAKAAGAPFGAEAPAPFDGVRAFADLEELADLGGRAAGSRRGAAARRKIRARLAQLGARVDERRTYIGGGGTESVPATHVRGVLPGDSRDLILLMAPYDTRNASRRGAAGADRGASGPALVLELARRLAERPRPYEIWLVFIDGDALPDDPEAPPAHLGSRSLAAAWAEEGVFDRVRAAFYFDQVAGREIRVARDLHSHRSYREVLWSVARELGTEEAFPRDAAFASPRGGHLAFRERQLRQIVAVIGSPFGSESAPEPSRDRPAQCSVESLQQVGAVTLAALERIQERLARIDRFAAAGAPRSPASP